VAADDQTPSDTPCPPCRGTGKVISMLGGERREVTCPWCEGEGTFRAEHDAQARWREQAGDDEPPPAAA
jgi:DnaJ-class molecular chaperone